MPMKNPLSLVPCLLLLGAALSSPHLALAQPAPAAKASAPSTAAALAASAPLGLGYNRRMDSKICTTAPRSEWLPEEEMKLLAIHRGYRIKTFRTDKNNCYEIYGFNQANQVIEAYFDPVTSRLLHQNIAK